MQTDRPTENTTHSDDEALLRSLAGGQVCDPALVEAVNHHLRTPIAVILGHAELLIDQTHEHPADALRSLAAVLRAGQRLNDMVGGICDLLDLACADRTSVEQIDVSTLVADEVAGWRTRAAQRALRLWVGGDPVVAGVADATRLRRALRELLDNATTYAPDGSTIRVVTTAASSGTRITVCDDGDGIDAADRERLVRPFERGAHPRQPAGRGMGLALVSAVATAHGGRLILSESHSGGLQACLELPSALPDPAER